MFGALAFLLATVSNPVARLNPDDHLIPENSVYTDISIRTQDPFSDLAKEYERNVVGVLIDAFNPSVVARVVVYPSFEPEYAVAMTFSDGRYSILHLEPSVQLYHFEVLKWLGSGADPRDPDGKKYLQMLDDLGVELPANRGDVEVDRCERQIPSALGSDLYVLWSEMLFRTRYPDYRPASPDDKPVWVNIGIDGTMYHFSYEYPGVTLAGAVHSPREGSDTGKFVAIAELMKDACHATDGAGVLNELAQRVDELTASLSETVY